MRKFIISVNDRIIEGEFSRVTEAVSTARTIAEGHIYAWERAKANKKKVPRRPVVSVWGRVKTFEPEGS